MQQQSRMPEMTHKRSTIHLFDRHSRLRARHRSDRQSICSIVIQDSMQQSTMSNVARNDNHGFESYSLSNDATTTGTTEDERSNNQREETTAAEQAVTAAEAVTTTATTTDATSQCLISTAAGTASSMQQSPIRCS